MAPNGLIFLLVVAIWGAYFVQHWIRRREHLSTARSMDRFSESLRVLARHGATPPPITVGSESAPSDPVRPRTSSYAAHLAARPGSTAGRVDMPSTDGWDWTPAAEPAHATVSRSQSDATPASASTVAEAANGGLEPGSHVRGVRVPRAVRGLVLLAQLLLVPTLAVAVLVTSLTWWAPAVAMAALVAALVWVRGSARAEVARRVSTYRSARLDRETADPHSIPEQRRPPLSDAVETTGTRWVARDDRPAGPRRMAEAEAPFDIDPPARATPVAAAAGSSRTAGARSFAHPAAVGQLLVDEDDIPLTWDPRPVPRPTYAMKGHVDRSAAYDELAVPGAQVPYDEEQNTRRAVGG